MFLRKQNIFYPCSVQCDKTLDIFLIFYLRKFISNTLQCVSL